MLTLTYCTISRCSILALESWQGQEHLITRYNRMWQSGSCDICTNILYRRLYYMVKCLFDESNGLWQKVL